MGKARILLVLLALGQLTCNQAIMTAPSGSTLSLSVNPDLIPSNGGVSVITALVIEPAGTVVADGTVVQFFTTLGVIDEQGKTNDGVARVNLRANGRSGVAKITAISGGDAVPAPNPSPTPTPTPAGTGAAPVSAAASTASAAATDSKDVTIGTVGAKSLLAIADPPQITSARGSSLIRATVFDTSGNPLPGVPVFFTVATTNNQSSSMDSGGRPVFTDSNGQAFDNLRTRSTITSTATVTVTVPSLTPVTVVVPISLP